MGTTACTLAVHAVSQATRLSNHSVHAPSKPSLKLRADDAEQEHWSTNSNQRGSKVFWL